MAIQIILPCYFARVCSIHAKQGVLPLLTSLFAVLFVLGHHTMTTKERHIDLPLQVCMLLVCTYTRMCLTLLVPVNTSLSPCIHHCSILDFDYKNVLTYFMSNEPVEPPPSLQLLIPILHLYRVVIAGGGPGGGQKGS